MRGKKGFYHHFHSCFALKGKVAIKIEVDRKVSLRMYSLNLVVYIEYTHYLVCLEYLKQKSFVRRTFIHMRFRWKVSFRVYSHNLIVYAYYTHCLICL